VRLQAAVQALAGLDKAALKVRYKEQLRRPRDEQASSGAGLGLIDIARKASEPLEATLREVDAARSFISLRAVI
jgi:ribosomal protein L16/L10AE